MQRVALEEGSHFMLLKGRLQDQGYDYGYLPVIPKLSLAIQETTDNIIDRIAVISLVHEGRGVKAVERLLGQLSKSGDNKSV